jgi:glutathione S-transferase
MPQIEPQNEMLKSLKGLHLWHASMSSCSQRCRIVLAETEQDYESHLVDLAKGEHATPEYQRIHPKGLVPAFVDNGSLYIESIDIIQQIAGPDSPLLLAASGDLLLRADDAQIDLKTLSHEFLFRAHSPISAEDAEAFDKAHQNDWLRQFRRDFANGFDPDRLNQAAARTDAGFHYLDAQLADGRDWLDGDVFSLSDVAWMPNVHRFNLMDWPFENTPYLASWFERIKARPSYKKGLLNWQAESVASLFTTYTQTRQAQKTHIRSLPHFCAI